MNSLPRLVRSGFQHVAGLQARHDLDRLRATREHLPNHVARRVNAHRGTRLAALLGGIQFELQMIVVGPLGRRCRLAGTDARNRENQSENCGENDDQQAHGSV
jgi:antitoxin component of MazEF toxin-antitoxin module